MAEHLDGPPFLLNIEAIPVTAISESICNLRSETSWNEIVVLAASIREKGLLEPIVVRRARIGFQLVAGSRRLKAFKYLGIEKIPCHIVEASDQEAYEISLIENIHHQSMNPIDESIAYRRYTEEFGYGTISELARRIGKSQEYVSLRLALLRLPDQVVQKVICRQITASTAQELLPLSAMQQGRLASMAVDSKLTKRQVRAAVRSIREDEYAGFDWARYRDAPERSGVCAEDVCIDKCVKILKTTMVDLADIIESFPNSSIVREMLLEYRLVINNEISSLLRIKMKRRSLEKKFGSVDSLTS